jgi:membrane-bound metal-dependent hydrolase YbcI (DUF457 family)
MLGLAAGLFALIPDIDVLYAFTEIAEVTSGFYGFTDSFWDASQQTHRGFTHSLVTSLIAVSMFSINYLTEKKYLAGVFIFLMTGLSYFLEGTINASIVFVFILTGFIITERIKQDISFRDFAAVSAFGLLAHPFGDVITGIPPDFLYPLPLELINERIIIFWDPSLNFLAVFRLELFLIWSGILRYVLIKEKNLREELSIVSATGFIYGTSSFFLTSPSLSNSYRFVFSIVFFSGLFTGLFWIFSETRDRKYFYAIVDFFSIMFFGYLSYLILFILT